MKEIYLGLIERNKDNRLKTERGQMDRGRNTSGS